jgi:cathepsin L
MANDGWAYAAIAAQEAQWKIKNGTLPSLSEFALIDCVDYGTPVFAYEAFSWAIEQHDGKFQRLDCYQTAKGTCEFRDDCADTSIDGYIVCVFGDEEDMVRKCADGVLTATLDASALEFVQYRSGIYDYQTCDAGKQSHEVAIIGYGGGEGEERYWILRNSWGDGWGMGGYMWFLRGSDLCGIAQLALLPLVTKSG